MKKIIKHYPMTDRLIVRRGYCLTQSKIKFDVHRLIVNVLNYLKKNDNSLAQERKENNKNNNNNKKRSKNNKSPKLCLGDLISARSHF
jgi:hypothetical protein